MCLSLLKLTLLFHLQSRRRGDAERDLAPGVEHDPVADWRDLHRESVPRGLPDPNRDPDHKPSKRLRRQFWKNQKPANRNQTFSQPFPKFHSKYYLQQYCTTNMLSYAAHKHVRRFPSNPRSTRSTLQPAASAIIWIPWLAALRGENLSNEKDPCGFDSRRRTLPRS